LRSQIKRRRRTRKGSRFKEEQIIAILRERESGSKTADICRKHGISSATFFKLEVEVWRPGDIGAQRVNILEDGNRKLNKLLAEAILDNAMLKDLNAKKW
jgi:putative transposase